MTQLQDWHQIRLQDTPVSPWKNGGGTTQSLVCWPSPSDWVFRMSVARIDSDGPFSEFKGVDRWFAVLSGEGVVLQFPERRVEVGALDAAVQFSGYLPGQCSVINGPTVDFNLMVQGVSANMARIDRSPYIAKFKAQTTLAIFVVAEGGRVRMGSQNYELNANSLYWITLDHDLEIEFNDMHLLLIQMESFL
ncbi:MAG: HutD family protein [Burkholderiales bacterium]